MALTPHSDDASAWPASLRFEHGVFESRYQVLRRLSDGGMGEVVLAEHLSLGKRVAIKVYTHRRGLDWSLLSREVEKIVNIPLREFFNEDNYCNYTIEAEYPLQNNVAALREFPCFAAVDELFSDHEGLGETVRRGLLGILKSDAELGAIAKKLAEIRQIVRSGNDQDILDPRQHQDGERVIDHRLVIDRHELLAHGDGQWIEPSAGASGEDNSFSFRHERERWRTGAGIASEGCGLDVLC